MNVYINHQTPELDEVGWRINRGMYMLVLDNEFLGGITNGRYTRGEGKEEGEGNP